MSLPPLPLIDGCLFIDNSGWVESMATCHRFLEYRSLYGRIPTGEKPSLTFGSAVHLGLEYRYKHYRNKPVDEEYYNQVSALIMNEYNEHPAPMDDWRTANWCLSLLRKYNEKYQQEDFNLLENEKGEVMVELAFALPLYTYNGSQGTIPIIYTGRIDLPVSLDGQVYVLDHKTTSMLGQTFFDGKRMSSQQRGYAWAFQQLTGQKVAGFIVNAIRTKEPPKYVTEGKESSRSGKTMNPAAWWQESFLRERYVLEENALVEWKENVIDLVEEFMWHYSRGYMPMKTEWCVRYGLCQYYDVCRLPKADRGFMLSSGMYTENTWSPLKQPTQSKQ